MDCGRRVLCSLVLILLLGHVLGDRWWFVATDGDNNNPGTPKKPFADLATAVAHASSGDTIQLASGTYSGAQNIGLSLDELTVIGSPNGDTILQSDFTNQKEEPITEVEVNQLIDQNAFCMNITNGRIRALKFTGCPIAVYTPQNEDFQAYTLEISNSAAGLVIGSSERIIMKQVSIDNTVNVGVMTVPFWVDGDHDDVDITWSYSTISAVQPLVIVNSPTTYVSIVHCRISAANVAHTTFLRGLYASASFSKCIIENFITDTIVTVQQGDLSIQSCIIRNNHCQDVCFHTPNSESRFSVRSCRVEFSSARKAFFVGGQQLDVDNCNFTSNEGPLFWTANRNYLSIQQSTFANNRAVAGPAVLGGQGSLTMTGVTFFNNSASLHGGAVSGQLDMIFKECQFDGNTAPRGGAVYANEGSVQFANCSFTGNVATGTGGALDIHTSSLSIQYCAFENNTATVGGAVFARTSGTMNHFLLRGNTASRAGGGIALINSQGMNLMNGNITDNHAPSGGAVWLNNTGVAIDYCFVANNSATTGAVVRLAGGEDVRVTLQNSTVVQNTASSEGSVIVLGTSKLSSNELQVYLEESTFQSNPGTSFSCHNCEDCYINNESSTFVNTNLPPTSCGDDASL